MSAMLPGFYVVRSYSHTDRQCLWKVLSRRFPIPDKESAQKHHISNPREFTRFQAAEWMEFCKTEDGNKKHEYRVVEVTESLCT